MNEFLFSFLITKFYSYNENILYILIDIEIFVEVQNCFEGFISKNKILNSFDMEYIKLDIKQTFYLPKEKNILFETMLDLHDNKTIYDYINNLFDIPRHSYHHLNIFINIFIGQYNKIKSKIRFIANDRDMTYEVIENFKKCTEYFIQGSFTNLLMDPNLINDKYKEKIIKIFSNDLKNEHFECPLIFINVIPQGKAYNYIYLFISKDYIGFHTFNKKNPENSDDFLNILKSQLNLETPVKKLKEIIDKDEYIITNDNFRKMVLIIYRIEAKLSVILMGETGCSKIFLIKELNEKKYI